MTTNAKFVPSPGLWSSLREAIAGSHQDYTAGSIERAILLLSVPMVLEMCMESLFGIVDVFWVAHLGSNAIATVGLTETCLTVVFAVALGLAMAATAIVARRTGEKDPEAASAAAVQAIAIGVFVSPLVGALGAYFAPDLLPLLAPSDRLY